MELVMCNQHKGNAVSLNLLCPGKSENYSNDSTVAGM